jgi:hypothetical protein
MKAGVLVFSFFAATIMASSAADPALPGDGLSGARYAALWEKSPFAIATPEIVSQDYELVGLAEFDGISYASLVDKATQEHFVLTSENPVRNIILISVHHGGQGASAVIERNGEQLVLEERNSNPGVGALAVVSPPAEEPIPPPTFRLLRPMQTRFHSPLVVVPPRPSDL